MYRTPKTTGKMTAALPFPFMDNHIQVTDNSWMYFPKGSVQTSKGQGQSYEGTEQGFYLSLVTVTKSWKLNLNCGAKQ